MDARPEAEDELADAYLALRWSLRDMLHRSGVYSNPGWSDDDIVDALARKLHVSTKHAAAVQAVHRDEPRSHVQTWRHLP